MTLPDERVSYMLTYLLLSVHTLHQIEQISKQFNQRLQSLQNNIETIKKCGCCIYENGNIHQRRLGFSDEVVRNPKLMQVLEDGKLLAGAQENTGESISVTKRDNKCCIM